MVQFIALAFLSTTIPAKLGNQTSLTRTYFQSIEPVLRAKCLPCHAPGRSGPFSLATYEQVKKHSELVRVKAMTGTMPPCLGESDFGNLCKTSKMTDAELVDLQRWIQAGMPRGEGEDRPAAPNIEWQLGKPSKTISITPSAAVRKEGTRYWITTILDPGIFGDLRAFDILPDDRQALQSVTLAYLAPGDPLRRPNNPETAGSVTQMGAKLIGAWAPGYKSWTLPHDTGLRIPKGARLVVQSHCQPLGRKASSGLKLGLYFANSPQKRQAQWITMSKDEFEIPANEAISFSMEKTLVKPVRVFAMLPEARFYCSRIRVTADLGSNSKRIFETMAWNPYWVGNFSPPAPISLGPNTRLNATFSYNNDERCSINEGKVPVLVKSGKTLGDEICKMHVLIAPL